MSSKYNVLIIGAGNIAALFDEPMSENVLTHAHAFSANPNFNLLGFVDIDKNKAVYAANKWGCKAFSCIEEAFQDNYIDVVSVAVPTNIHYQVLKNLAKFNVKLIFTEKPLTTTLEEAEKIREIYKGKPTKFLVNYIRRFIPEFNDIRSNILSGKYGNFITGNAFYDKGILNKGSHIIDLLTYLSGNVVDFKYLSSVADFNEQDKTVSAILYFENNCPLYLQSVNCNCYSIFEIDLLYEYSRIRIHSTGELIEIYDVVDDKAFKGYKVLSKTREIRNSLNRTFEYAANNIYNYLTSGEELKSTLDDAYQVLKLCLNIKESANEK